MVIKESRNEIKLNYIRNDKNNKRKKPSIIPIVKKGKNYFVSRVIWQIISFDLISQAINLKQAQFFFQVQNWFSVTVSTCLVWHKAKTCGGNVSGGVEVSKNKRKKIYRFFFF